ncbi:hypothetical protein IW261DRAFT_1522106 [Armillaria novae-zelandiae]|uniref:Uncharacterized protein n=1 Tax=Armillaria novae-zelandiae TaxID=153914 RepID=A0AA39NHP2_9AGAR|nr:hypothetical protein IW261DRAFT_1522106 [Armillaria novae-zelandiae]
MDVPFDQTVLSPSVQSVDTLPIVNGSTNLVDHASQQQETGTNMDSTPVPPPSPLPLSGWVSQSTRMHTHPCHCGKSECVWHFIYLDQMIVATHKVLGSLRPILTHSTNPASPKVSSRQKETSHVSFVEGPIFIIHKTFATPIIRPGSEADVLRFLECKPWADMRPDKLVCLGCRCDVRTHSPGSWMYHRNSCEGIDNTMLRSVVDVWEAEVGGFTLIEEL